MATEQRHVLEVTTPSATEIQMTRLFDAPRELVFDAWTQPEHLAHWFGPRGWQLTTCEVELREGGTWRYVMQGPDGTEFGMRGEYREIARPERLVSTEIFDDYPDHETLATLILEEVDGKTRMVSIARYDAQATRDAVIASGMEQGLAESLDRLEEHLSSPA